MMGLADATELSRWFDPLLDFLGILKFCKTIIINRGQSASVELSFRIVSHCSYPSNSSFDGVRYLDSATNMQREWVMALADFSDDCLFLRFIYRNIYRKYSSVRSSWIRRPFFRTNCSNRSCTLFYKKGLAREYFYYSKIDPTTRFSHIVVTLAQSKEVLVEYYRHIRFCLLDLVGYGT